MTDAQSTISGPKSIYGVLNDLARIFWNCER